MSDGNAEFQPNADVSEGEKEEAYLIANYQQQYLERLLTASPATLSAEQIKSFKVLATELAKEKRDNEKRYKYDRLMGNLLTRAGLDDALERIFAHKERQTNSQSVLIFVDVDHLKETNDRLGHEAGDDALRAVDRTVGQIIRKSDIAGRYGGDEAVILLQDTDIKNAAVIANRARETLNSEMKEFRGKYGVGGVSFSIGLVPYRQGMSVKDTLREADEAMYVAKHQLNRDAIAISGLTNPKEIEETHKYLQERNINAPIVGVPLARDAKPIKSPIPATPKS